MLQEVVLRKLWRLPGDPQQTVKQALLEIPPNQTRTFSGNAEFFNLPPAQAANGFFRGELSPPRRVRTKILKHISAPKLIRRRKDRRKPRRLARYSLKPLRRRRYPSRYPRSPWTLRLKQGSITAFLLVPLPLYRTEISASWTFGTIFCPHRRRRPAGLEHLPTNKDAAGSLLASRQMSI